MRVTAFRLSGHSSGLGRPVRSQSNDRIKAAISLVPGKGLADAVLKTGSVVRVIEGHNSKRRTEHGRARSRPFASVRLF